MSPSDPLIVRLWDVQNGACFHCGEPMLNTGESNHGHHWSREHIYPRSRNGSTYGNVVLAHRRCNSMRGNAAPSEEEIERARLIIAAVGEIPFKFIDPMTGASRWLIPLRQVGAIGQLADVWPAGVAEQADAAGLNPAAIVRGSSSLPARTKKRKQVDFVGHDVEYAEYSTQAAFYVGKRKARDLKRLRRLAEREGGMAPTFLVLEQFWSQRSAP